MKDQRKHWNDAHAKKWLYEYSVRHTAFAEEIAAIIPSNASILELGCGDRYFPE